MKVHELIAELQNFDLDAEVQVMGISTQWGYNGESSYEFDSATWMGVEGAAKPVGCCSVLIYAQSEDLEEW